MCDVWHCDQRVSPDDLMREVEHWKRVAQHHKQSEAQMQEQLQKTNQRASELQRQLGEKQQECTVLTESRNVALSQITTLKKHAAQLQSFKKNISNMLQVTVITPSRCTAVGEWCGRGYCNSVVSIIVLSPKPLGKEEGLGSTHKRGEVPFVEALEGLLPTACAHSKPSPPRPPGSAG